jgi:hypothetical protein
MRWPEAPIAGALIAIVGLVPVLAEVVVRDHMRDSVVAVSQRELHTSTVTVDLGPAPMLVNLVAGRIPHIVVSADEASVCWLTDAGMVADLFDVSIGGTPEIGRSQRHHSLAGLPLGIRPAAVRVNSIGLIVDLAGGSGALPTAGTDSPCRE